MNAAGYLSRREFLQRSGVGLGSVANNIVAAVSQEWRGPGVVAWWSSPAAAGRRETTESRSMAQWSSSPRGI